MKQIILLLTLFASVCLCQEKRDSSSDTTLIKATLARSNWGYLKRVPGIDSSQCRIMYWKKTMTRFDLNIDKPTYGWTLWRDEGWRIEYRHDTMLLFADSTKYILLYNGEELKPEDVFGIDARKEKK